MGCRQWEGDGHYMGADRFVSINQRDLRFRAHKEIGFRPELDFEELCWEDGQLFVMQGLNCRGTAKNRTTDETILTSVSPTYNAFDTPHAAALVDSNFLKTHTQEDELLSWLQHPAEDMADGLETPSGLHILSTPLADRERVYPIDITHQGFLRNLGLPMELDNGPAQKFIKCDTLANFSPRLGNRTNNGSIKRLTESAAVPALVPSTNLQRKEPCESFLPLTAEGEMSSLPHIHSASVNTPYSATLPNTSTSGMHKSESLDSSRIKHLKLIAPRREGTALHAVPSLCQSVGAPSIHGPRREFSSKRELKKIFAASHLVKRPDQDSSTQKVADQDLSPTGTLIRSFRKGIGSDGCKSSIISSTTPGMDASIEVFQVAEPLKLSSPGGSEDSDDVDGKRCSEKVKRNIYNKDRLLHSEALENEVAGDKKQAAVGVNGLKRSKATKSHNQSERRRRDRISEKMKALQALVPNSYKVFNTDKASVLEDVITYIKALKSQIQIMSYRGGMYYSPMVSSHGVQHVQMTSWPLLNMGMYDMNMVVGTAAPRPFSPPIAFPSALGRGPQTTASTLFDTAHMTSGIAGQVVPIPADRLLVPGRPGISTSVDNDSTLVANDASPWSYPTSQQG